MSTGDLQNLELAARYADEKLGGIAPDLGKRIRSGNVHPTDSERLKQLQQREGIQEGDHKLIALVLRVVSVLQQRVRNQVRSVAPEPINTVRNAPGGQGGAAAALRGAQDFLSNKGGNPQSHIQELEKKLNTQLTEDQLITLFMDLSAPDRDMSDVRNQVIARALINIVSQSATPLWVRRIANGRERFQSLQKNIAAAEHTPINGGHGTRIDTFVEPHRSATLPYGAQAIPGRPPTLAVSVPHAHAPVVNAAPEGNPVDVNEPIVFDPYADEFKAKERAPRSWGEKASFEVIRDLKELSTQAAYQQQSPLFVQVCREAFTEFLESKPYDVSTVLKDLLEEIPDLNVQTMIAVLCEEIRNRWASLAQAGNIDMNLLTELYNLGKKRMHDGPIIMQWMMDIKNDPDKFLSQLYKLINAPIDEQGLVKDEHKQTMMNHKTIIDLCNDSIVKKHYRNLFQDALKCFEMKVDLASSLKEQGKFRITKFLAAGGMGSVFLAEKITFGKKTTRVAIKVSQSSGIDVKGFEREAQILDEVKGPHIVDALESGTTNTGKPYIVMEYVPGYKEGTGAYDGKAFLEMLRNYPVPADAIAIIAWKLALGVKEFQDQGIVQRDLKPDNFLMTPLADGAFAQWREDRDDERLIRQLHKLAKNDIPLIKWTDFGLARKKKKGVTSLNMSQENIHKEFEGKEIDPINPFTFISPGGVAGTPGYMTPQMSSGEPVDQGADEYALGLIFFELFSHGQWPRKREKTALQYMLQPANLHKEGEKFFIPVDHEVINELRNSDHMSIVADLMLEMTTMFDPYARGSIDDIVEKLETVAMYSTSAFKENREAQKEKREAQAGQASLRKKLGVLGTISSALAIAGLLFFANMRSAEDIGYGKQRIAWVEKSKDLDSFSIQELRLHLKDLERLQNAQPEGYEANSDEPNMQKVRQLVMQIELEIVKKSLEILKADIDSANTRVSGDLQSIADKYASLSLYGKQAIAFENQTGQEVPLDRIASTRIPGTAKQLTSDSEAMTPNIADMLPLADRLTDLEELEEQLELLEYRTPNQEASDQIQNYKRNILDEVTRCKTVMIQSLWPVLNHFYRGGDLMNTQAAIGLMKKLSKSDGVRSRLAPLSTSLQTLDERLDTVRDLMRTGETRFNNDRGELLQASDLEQLVTDRATIYRAVQALSFKDRSLKRRFLVQMIYHSYNPSGLSTLQNLLRNTSSRSFQNPNDHQRLTSLVGQISPLHDTLMAYKLRLAALISHGDRISPLPLKLILGAYQEDETLPSFSQHHYTTLQNDPRWLAITALFTSLKMNIDEKNLLEFGDVEYFLDAIDSALSFCERYDEVNDKKTSFTLCKMYLALQYRKAFLDIYMGNIDASDDEKTRLESRLFLDGLVHGIRAATNSEGRNELLKGYERLLTLIVTEGDKEAANDLQSYKDLARLVRSLDK